MNALKRTALIIEFEAYLNDKEYRFVKESPFKHMMNTKRMFRADYFCPAHDIIIEINGGQFMGGRHNRGGKGYETDLIKINTASINGFVILQFTYEMLERLEYKEYLP